MMALVQSDLEESLARSRPASRVSFRALAWAAGLVVLAALAGVFLFNRTPSFESPVVASVQGEVRSLGASGEYVLASGQSWRSGETLKTLGPNSAVTLTFRDGSHLDFGGDTVAGNESGQDGWRVRMDHGLVQTTLQKQPARRPCVFATPNAEAIVAGTKLRLLVSGHATRLDVIAGEVRFRRRHDGAEVRVRASQYAVVAPNAPFAATPFHADPHHP
jgi:ferric-dicitrate binding protein FerR (iron transport regulator)